MNLLDRVAHSNPSNQEVEARVWTTQHIQGYPEVLKETLSSKTIGWGSSSVLEHLLSMPKALSLVCNTGKKKGNEGEERRDGKEQTADKL